MIDSRKIRPDPPTDPQEYAKLLRENADERAVFLLRLEVYFNDLEAFKSQPEIIRRKADHFIAKFQELYQLSLLLTPEEFPELLAKMESFKKELQQHNIHIHFPELN